MPDVATTDLCRAVPFTITRATDDESGDGLTLEGYGAVFDTPTRIDSWEGTFDETIAQGAFKKSLNERTPRLQFDHGTHPLIGSIPIGRITDIGEDPAGLRVTARLSDNWLVEPVRDAIKDGAVDGMSFRFSVVRDTWVDANGKTVKTEDLANVLWGSDPERGLLTRTLKEVKISEVGPVVWPAYEATSVAVRSKVTIDLGRLNDPAQRANLARAVMLADSAQRAQNVEAGQRIGTTDGAGNSTGPHIRHEFVSDDTPTDPSVTAPDQGAADGTATPETPAPPITPKADEHAEGSTTITPQTTDTSAGEHETDETSPDPDNGVSQEDAEDEGRAAINAALLEMRDSLTLTLTR